MKNLFLLCIIVLASLNIYSQCKPLVNEKDEFNGKMILSYGDKGFFGNSLKANDRKDNAAGKIIFTKIDTSYYMDFDLSCSFVWGVTINSVVEIKLKNNETLNLNVSNNNISKYSNGGPGSYLNNSGRVTALITEEILEKLSKVSMQKIRIAVGDQNILTSVSSPEKILKNARCLLNDKNS